MILRLRNAYLAKVAADPKSDPVAKVAIEDHFQPVNGTIRSMERMRKEAEGRPLGRMKNLLKVFLFTIKGVRNLCQSSYGAPAARVHVTPFGPELQVHGHLFTCIVDPVSKNARSSAVPVGAPT
jgi:hypothetical protein